MEKIEEIIRRTPKLWGPCFYYDKKLSRKKEYIKVKLRFTVCDPNNLYNVFVGMMEKIRIDILNEHQPISINCT